MNEQTTDLTDATPTMNPETRTKVKKVVAIGIFAAGAILLIDDQVKKFKERKSVTVTVKDTPA